MARQLTPGQEQEMYEGNREAWRYMLPFFLIMAVFILVVYRFVSAGAPGAPAPPPAPLECPQGAERIVVSAGESCWAIASARGKTVPDLVALNRGLDCSLLKAGAEICAPLAE